jgi:hypothetical protein
MNGAAFPSSTTTTTTSQSYNNTGSSRNIVPLNCSSLLLTNQAADDWIRTLQFPQKVYWYVLF